MAENRDTEKAVGELKIPTIITKNEDTEREASHEMRPYIEPGNDGDRHRLTTATKNSEPMRPQQDKNTQQRKPVTDSRVAAVPPAAVDYENDDAAAINHENGALPDRQKPTHSRAASYTKTVCAMVVMVLLVVVLAILALAIATLNMNRLNRLQANTAVYTRWGSSSCPHTPDTSMVYNGLMAGHNNNASGTAKGGTNFQCLPLQDVEYTLPFQAGTQGEIVIHGTEYKTSVKPESNNHNVPCAVCLIRSRTIVTMTPAHASCPPLWTREYRGYLMAQANSYSTYECVDEAMEIQQGSALQENIAILTHVEASCTGLPCHPYMPDKELNCVVCSI